MRSPYRAPRCEGQWDQKKSWFTRWHNCGLRGGHKGAHSCRKRTCRAEWVS